MTTRGTPKTLEQAIGNGFQAAMKDKGRGFNFHTALHVRDFLAQKIGVEMLMAKTPEVSEALERLTQELGMRKSIEDEKDQKEAS